MRLQATAVATDLKFNQLSQQLMMAPDEPVSPAVRQAYFGAEHGLQATPIRRRHDIDSVVTGPVIVEEPDTTIVVPPQWMAQRDGLGNVILRADTKPSHSTGP